MTVRSNIGASVISRHRRPVGHRLKPVTAKEIVYVADNPGAAVTGMRMNPASVTAHADISRLFRVNILAYRVSVRIKGIDRFCHAAGNIARTIIRFIRLNRRPSGSRRVRTDRPVPGNIPAVSDAVFRHLRKPVPAEGINHPVHPVAGSIGQIDRSRLPGSIRNLRPPAVRISSRTKLISGI